MKISQVNISVVEMPGVTPRFNLEESGPPGRRTWRQASQSAAPAVRHIMHVLTDEGLEGICTVGDVRYVTMEQETLERLRILATGEDPLDRERLFSKLSAATRRMFVQPGWFGAFDNCLWDIAGKAAGLPVCALIGRARRSAPAYYNFRGETKEAAVEDARSAVAMGFPAVKDHFHRNADTNIEWFRAVRDAVGPEVDALHDAAGCAYRFDEAVRVGRALEDLRFRWFEEPLPDRSLSALQALCRELDLPVLAPETMMHDISLSAEWLLSGATDMLRANARHGVTGTLKLARLAEMTGTSIELNGPGGLFGLVHAHMACAIPNTSYYEYFPDGTRDEAGREIGLENPPVPQDGFIAPPDAPGWGYEWDREYLRRKTVAEM